MKNRFENMLEKKDEESKVEVLDAMKKAAAWNKIEPVGVDTGIDFDDTESVFLGENSVMGIVIRSGYIVDAIGLLRSGMTKEPLHGSTYGGGENLVIWDCDDEVIAIEGTAEARFADGGGAVSELIIKTKKGRTYGPYGNGKGKTSFCHEIPEGGKFRGFCGCIGKGGNGGYLAALGVVYEKSDE